MTRQPKPVDPLLSALATATATVDCLLTDCRAKRAALAQEERELAAAVKLEYALIEAKMKEGKHER